ncbi:MAG: hypothetical protein ABWZ91_05650 [Nocardioides sp.]|jgi:hypothetical protein
MLDASPAPARTRRADLLLHLCTDAVGNRAFFGRDGLLDTKLLVDAIRGWCARCDMDLHVRPVIDQRARARRPA